MEKIFSKKYENQKILEFLTNKYKLLNKNFIIGNKYDVVKIISIDKKNNIINFNKINYTKTLKNLLLKNYNEKYLLFYRAGVNLAKIHKSLNGQFKENETISIYGDYHPGNILIGNNEKFINIDLEPPKSELNNNFYKKNLLYLDISTFIVWSFHLYPISKINIIIKNFKFKYIEKIVEGYEGESNMKLDRNQLKKYLEIEINRKMEYIKNSKSCFIFWKIYYIFLIKHYHV